MYAWCTVPTALRWYYYNFIALPNQREAEQN
jgi:hypothetical protein